LTSSTPGNGGCNGLKVDQYVNGTKELAIVQLAQLHLYAWSSNQIGGKVHERRKAVQL
jgi:hypothetical protein